MAVASVTKITAPIVWDINPKFRIQDLRESHYDEVITLIKHHYFREEPTCKSSDLLKDSLSVEKYTDLIRLWLKDTCSLVAVSEKSGRVVGVAVARINSLPEYTNTYSRVQIHEGDAMESIMKLKNALVMEANAYETFGADIYLRIYVLCVHPSYKKKRVGHALIESCCLVASSMEIPVIAGIFTSNEHQTIAENMGFSLLMEIPYKNWLVNGEVVFDDPGVGNYSAAYMYIMTPDEDTLLQNRKIREKEEKLLIQKKKERKKRK